MNDNLRAAAAVATIIGTVVAVLTFFRDADTQVPNQTTQRPRQPSISDMPRSPSYARQCQPSFDCAVDRRHADQLVCRTPDLCERDRRMDALYRQARARTDTANWPRIRQAQRDWWSYRRNTCPDADCLRRVYDERIRELEAELRR